MGGDDMKSAPSSDINAYLSPAAFLWPRHIEPSGWLEHAPFAFWMMDALRPRCAVELGTHHGFSYFSLCQAADSLGLDTACYAVDHWSGDEHAGHYEEDVFERVQAHNQQNYSAFSTLIRSTFKNALPYFPNHSIDLLHIDGRHFYDDVRQDFEDWTVKLSDRAVVLFHDTNVRERGFGVFKFWNEIRESHPSFEFLHGHGLGVLGVGSALPETMVEFFATARDPRVAPTIRQVYSRLGSAIRQIHIDLLGTA